MFLPTTPRRGRAKKCRRPILGEAKRRYPIERAADSYPRAFLCIWFAPTRPCLAPASSRSLGSHSPFPRHTVNVHRPIRFLFAVILCLSRCVSLWLELLGIFVCQGPACASPLWSRRGRVTSKILQRLRLLLRYRPRERDKFDGLSPEPAGFFRLMPLNDAETWCLQDDFD